MRRVLPLALLVGSLCLGGCTPSEAPRVAVATDTDRASSPLVGSWVAEAFGGAIHERWEQTPDGVVVKAEGYYIAEGDTSYSETVAMGQLGARAYLVAHPSTGGVLVWEQTAATADSTVYENPNVANPSRIVYAFSSDSLFTRTLYGRDGDEDTVTALRFVRQ